MLMTIDERDARPVYIQIAAGIKEQVRDGRLQQGEELPSVRELADALGINLHTVHRAYQVLRDENVITLRLGSRAKVAPLRTQPADPETISRRLTPRMRDLVTEAFHLGLSAADVRRLLEAALLDGTPEGEGR
jgi:GntR family transcriptional regulator